MRHGESLGNAAGILQGRGEYSLSPEGAEQVRKKARFIAELAADFPPENRLLFSSPQSRARESAEILVQDSFLPEPVVIDDLKEMHLGEWTGKTWADINGGTGGAWDTFRTKSWDAVRGAETSGELFERAIRVWGLLRDTVKVPDTLVFAVSHGGLIQWLLKSSLGCRSWFPLFPIGNCGLFVFRAEPNRDSEAYTAWELIDG